MIRFSASLVVVAVGLLIAGVVTSKLMLVYIAIGVSGVALLALGIGAAVHWRELTGKPTAAAAQSSASQPAAAQQAAVPAQQATVPAQQAAVPSAAAPSAQPQAHVPAAAGAGATGSAWPAASEAPSRAGYLPTEPPQAQSAAPSPSAVPSEPETRRQPPAQDQAPAQNRAMARAPGQDQAAARAPGQDEPRDGRQDDAGENETDPVPGAGPTFVAANPASPQAEQDQPLGKAEPARPEPDAPSLDPSREVTVVPGVPRYHNAHCILIRFMSENDLNPMSLAAAREAGCTPCRACLPDQPEKSSE